MIKCYSIGSSSKGNCFVINDGVTTLLVDAGLHSEDIQVGLFKLGIRLKDISGVIITHEHQDHIQGINAVRGCKKYMSKGTFEASQNSYRISEKEVEIVKDKETFKVGTWTIKGFKVQHDAKEPLGFIFKNASGETLLYLTDTGIANINFNNADFYIIESNHSEVQLKKDFEDGNMPESRYKRISKYHLSTEKAIDYLKRNIGDKTKQVILMHMSPRNEKPMNNMNWVRKELNKDYVHFIHPNDHKVEQCFEAGYKPSRQRTF